ncbi:hypothetical protein, partial [Salmonella enterica]|uniref:hypothetical protein n=1 Tax=Salmonella enterica TaxID=28901 RepID=UPI0021555A23
MKKSFAMSTRVIFGRIALVRNAKSRDSQPSFATPQPVPVSSGTPMYHRSCLGHFGFIRSSSQSDPTFAFWFDVMTGKQYLYFGLHGLGSGCIQPLKKSFAMSTRVIFGRIALVRNAKSRDSQPSFA